MLFTLLKYVFVLNIWEKKMRNKRERERKRKREINREWEEKNELNWNTRVFEREIMHTLSTKVFYCFDLLIIFQSKKEKKNTIVYMCVCVNE